MTTSLLATASASGGANNATTTPTAVISSSVDATIREFCTFQKTWLEQELQEEQDEATINSTDANSSSSSSSSSSSKKKKISLEEQEEGRAARVLGHLEASEISIGLYGRTVVQLVKTTTAAAQNKSSAASSTTAAVAAAAAVESSTAPSTTNKKDNDLLPAHKFTTGDEVEIRSKSGGSGNNNNNSVSTGGVVTAVTDTSISVALFSGRQRNGGGGRGGGGASASSSSSKKNRNAKTNKNDENDTDDDTGGLGNPPYTLLPTSSIEVHRKLVEALNELEKHGVNHPTAGHVIQALFQDNDDHFATTARPKSSSLDYPNSSGLDDSQLEAIDFALQNQRPVALIHGPPGTGKTTTIVELIRRAVLQHGMKVLVAAPSNVAVDNVLSRLVAKNSNNNTSTYPTDRGDGEDAHGDDNNKDMEEEEENQNKPKRSRDWKHKKNKKLRLVRLGHPARLQANILPYSLEALVQSADGTEVVADARQELQALLRILSSSSNKKSSSKSGGAGGDDYYTKKKLAHREVKLLRKEIRQREEQVVQELLQQADVVLATCVGAANRLLGNDKKNDKSNVSFDLVVIDEAAQALEAACWIPALRVGSSGKLVLAGDHCQLPPTIKSHIPQVVQGLGKTMFERLMELYGDDLSADAAAKKNQNAKKDDPSSNSNKGANMNKVHSLGRVSRMLRTQYRMHQKISDWSSNALYGGQLLTHKSVASRTLAQLAGTGNDKEIDINSNDEDGDVDGVSKTALLLIDTAGCAMYERKNEAGSRSNEMEGQIVAQHVRKLLALGVQEEQIAVITPYNGQVELLRTLLLPEAPKLEIRSVDGFQGGEREAVVLSLVRSSERGGMDGIGFLRDDRRLNVAVTRAKRHCCVVCDSETVSQSSFVQGLVQWMEEHGESRSAIEYMSSEGNNELQLQSDLALAELEIQRLLKAAAPPPKAKDSVLRKKPSAPSASKAEDEERRKGILDQVRAFAEKGSPGDEMSLNAELSSYDRMFVHELAEKLCIDHESQGVDGVDRRIVLSIPQKTLTATNIEPLQSISEAPAVVSSSTPSDDATPLHDDSVDIDEDTTNKGGDYSLFVVLNDSGNESDDEEAANDESEPSPEPTMNSLLGNLAKERAQRQRQATKASGTAATAAKPKAKKKKGQKLGGDGVQKKVAVPKDNEMDELDDMAFLDAQIDKVQNAHGRKLDAKGKAYRTVINGILTPTQRPEPEKKRDAKSVATLQTKLKNAQDSRKVKPKPKK